MVANYIAAFPKLIRYNRMATNIGIRNFFVVIDMAQGEYCWLIGSDDAVLPYSIGRIIEILTAIPELPGITVNKLNFDCQLTQLIGPDHDQALPEYAEISRVLSEKSNILSNLFTSFFFISSHIFKKKHWDNIIDNYGVENLLKFEHFPHVFVYSQIAIRYEKWFWLADYCVIQRLENFSYFTEVSNKKIDYATQLTADLESIASILFSDNKHLYRKIMSKLFFLYWNPIYTIQYVSDLKISHMDIADARQKCVSWFSSITYFWLTTYLILFLPPRINRFIVRGFLVIYVYIRKKPSFDRIREIGRNVYHTLLCILGVESTKDRSLVREKEIAKIYLRMRSKYSDIS